MEPFAVYKDIQARTKGQFLLGVVGRANPHLSGGSWNFWHFREWKNRMLRRCGISCRFPVQEKQLQQWNPNLFPGKR